MDKVCANGKMTRNFRQLSGSVFEMVGYAAYSYAVYVASNGFYVMLSSISTMRQSIFSISFIV